MEITIAETSGEGHSLNNLWSSSSVVRGSVVPRRRGNDASVLRSLKDSLQGDCFSSFDRSWSTSAPFSQGMVMALFPIW